VAEAGRFALLPRLGIEPTVQTVVREALDGAIRAAEKRSPGDVTVLDAGCGRVSALRQFRSRIHRMVGADIHRPSAPLPHLDEFTIADLCGPSSAFPADSFDVVLSNFTLEHFQDPGAALANLHHWLRPGGTLVVTTVNRRHPFVAAYLGMPPGVRHALQRLVKASEADAHPLVGVCNDPATIRAGLEVAGFGEIELRTVGHLARAWGRHLPTFALGLAGDLLARGTPSRRSTIIAVAGVPSAPG
jgi:SAM-dependent methyltransferase